MAPHGKPMATGPDDRPLCYTHLATPVGPLLLAGDDAALVYISFPTGKRPMQPSPNWVQAETPFAETKAQLTAYFAGALQAFDLPLRPEGTAFQLSVWAALAAIPYGAIRSYADIARTIGKPTATRPVGAANGANPLPIVIPCHRVVGANGALTGFGGGVETKRYLLNHEAQTAPASIGGLWRQR